MLPLVIALLTSTLSAQDVSVADAFIQLPEAESTSARAVVVVKNPTMYDVYLISAVSSDVAGKIEFRRGGETVKEISVAAYGSLKMKPDGVHLRLVDLKRPLELDEKIRLTLTTDGGVKLRVQAVVRDE